MTRDEIAWSDPFSEFVDPRPSEHLVPREVIELRARVTEVEAVLKEAFEQSRRLGVLDLRNWLESAIRNIEGSSN